MGLRDEWARLMGVLGHEDPNLVVLVGDISHGILGGFRSRFPGRYFNVGICEPTIVGVAAGLAHFGMNPVIHTIAPFLTERALEQLKLDFGYQGLSANLVSVGGSFDYSQLGCTHHTYSDASLVSQIEGSEVYLPSSSVELRKLITSRYRSPGLKYFRLTENPHSVEIKENEIEPGKAIVVRTGSDVTISALGPRLEAAVRVAEILEPEISVEVVYHHTFKPFDTNTVRASVEKTRALISVEELGEFGGMHGMAMTALGGSLKFEHRQMAVKKFVRGYGSYENLAHVAGLSDEHLLTMVRECVSVNLGRTS